MMRNASPKGDAHAVDADEQRATKRTAALDRQDIVNMDPELGESLLQAVSAFDTFDSSAVAGLELCELHEIEMITILILITSA